MKINLLRNFIYLLLLVCFNQTAFGQTVFLDDFNRVAVSPGGSPELTYTITNNSNTGSPVIESTTATGTVPYLKIIGYLSAGTTAGQSFITGPLSSFSSPFNPRLNLNTGTISWSFNIRENHGTMTGLAGRFVGVVLAASETDLLSSTCTGYMISQGTTTTSGYQLVKFGAGLGTSGTTTTIVAAPTLVSSKDWVSVKVTYDPTSETWTLFERTDGPSATPSWSDPSTTSALVGSATDNTYTSTTMTTFGYFVNHTASNVAFNTLFDNFKVAITPNAPSWTSNYPKITTITSSGFTPGVNINVAGKAYYAVLASGASAPTSAQVKAGKDAADAAAISSGFINCTSGNNEYSSAVSGLTQNTSYDVYFVAEDLVPNLQSTPVKVSVTTTLPEGPALTAAWVNNDVEHNFDITFTENASWRTAVTDIKIGSTSLNTSDWDKTQPGIITIKPLVGNTLLTTAGIKSVTIIATGYANTMVSQEIKPGAISLAKSLLSVTPALGPGLTSSVTLTAKDQFENLIQGYIFKYNATITNSVATTAESYTIAEVPVTASVSDVSLDGTNATGQKIFNIILPAMIDGSDGISVQVKFNNGTDNLGTALTYTSPVAPALLLSPAAVTEHSIQGAVITLTNQNTTFTDATFDKSNFTLLNAPSGITIASATWAEAGKANLTLAYDDANNDFDSDVTNFTVKILAAELSSGADLTGNNITLTAITETSPTVTTNANIASKSVTTASWSGNVSSDGGEPITVKGLCWGLTPDPSVSDSKTTEAAGTGTIEGNMTGLTQNTTYFVRAYATNAVGTAYGNSYSFTTNKTEPANHVTSVMSSTINATSVTLTFTGSAGDYLPDGYLVLGKTGSGSFAIVTDQSEISNDNDWSNFNFAKTLTHADGTNTVTITGLTANTSYDFFIYPYANSGPSIDYKTDGAVPAITVSTLNSAKDILTFSFSGITATANINATNATITIPVPSGTDLANLIAVYTLSSQASATISSVAQSSGVTANNFSSPVIYKVTAGDVSTKDWTINVTVAGEPLAYDPFDYPADQLISAQTAKGWAAYSTAGATEVQVAAGSLSYPGLIGSKGNKIIFDGAGTDVSKSFTAQSTPGTKVYYSFIFQVDNMSPINSTTGSHFAGFSQTTSNVGASVYLKWDGVTESNKFFIGIAVRGATASVPVYTTSSFEINKPILIVGCYEIVEGLANDKSYLWINPSADDLGIGTQPAATLSADGGVTSDLTSVGYFYIRQDAANLTPFIAMDELRVGLSWSEVTPKAGSVTFNPPADAIDVDVTVKPSITFTKPIRKIGGTALTNGDLIQLLKYRLSDASGADVPFNATINQEKQVITITPASLPGFSKTYYISVGAVEESSGAVLSSQSSRFTTRASRDNSKLGELKISGNLIPDFNAATFSYNKVLEYGTTTVPALTYTLSDANATAVYTPAASLPGSSKVEVTAEDGVTKTTYTVNFSVATTPSTDSKLKDLKVGGVSVPAFVSGTYEYTYNLPFGTVTPPIISAVANSAVATMTITQARSATDMAFVEVKAQDGTTRSTYTIIFSIDAYVYKVGFETANLPFPDWSTSNTIVSSNFGTLPIINHALYTGTYAFRFIAGKPSVPPTVSGRLVTSKYPNCGNVAFWLYVQLSDGNEKLLIHKRVKGVADSIKVAEITSAQMVSTGWKEFSFDVNEKDSTQLIFTSVLTQDATSTSGGTRIWMDDLSLRGKLFSTGINTYKQGPEVTIFPNPVMDKLKINTWSSGYQKFEIINSRGIVVLAQKITDPLIYLDIAHLEKGIYYIRFRNGQYVQVKNFTKF